LYVLGKDADANTVIVGTQEELGSSELIVRDVNWVSGIPQTDEFRALVKIRYSAKEVEAWVKPLDNGTQVEVRFDAPVRDITAGQAAVFYDGEVMLGGGIII